jgi:spermidine synthase
VARVDYVELDPLLLELIRDHGAGPTRQELSDSRVEFHYTDGRLFAARTPRRYDVVFVGPRMPVELQTNRLYTAEFFAIAKTKMNEEGILVLSLPGSLTYLSAELRKLNRCILDTLRSVFAHVRVIPGERNLYFASASGSLASAEVAELVRRLEERRVRTLLVQAPYIEYRLQEQWLQGYERAMAQTPGRINSDFRPLAVFYALSHWNALFSPDLADLFARFEEVRLGLFALVVGAGSALLATLVLAAPRAGRMPVAYAIATTGFCGMVFDLAVIFTFQSLFGYLYYQIALLVTAFMAGAAAGALYASRRATRRVDPNSGARSLLLHAELLLVLFALLLPSILVVPSRFPGGPRALALLFLGASFSSGALTGFEFPLAARLHLRPAAGGTGLAQTAGLLYGADLLGGYFGGLIGGVLLLPILGTGATCLVMALVKGGSSLLVLMHNVRARGKG